MFISKRELREIRLRLERLEEIVASGQPDGKLPAHRTPTVATPRCAADPLMGHSFDGDYICEKCGLKAAGAK